MPAKSLLTEEERFYEKVIPVPESGCWLWTAAADDKGYGRFQLGSGRRGTVLSHRFAYELRNGPIPAGLNALHKCDTPSCVNPDHIFLGTLQDNVRDMDRKGRRNNPMPKTQRGSAHYAARFTDQQVREIRRDARRVCVIAREYGVGHGSISTIKSGKSWAHVQ